MKTFFTLVTISLINFYSIAQLQFNTGNIELDASLNNINVEAKVDLGIFKANLKTEFGIENNELDNLFSLKMEPAEVYLALEIGKIANRKTSEIITVYKDNKSKGWGYIAKELGIKPGSPEFHALKNKAKNKKDKGNKKPNQGVTKGNGKKK